MELVEKLPLILLGAARCFDSVIEHLVGFYHGSNIIGDPTEVSLQRIERAVLATAQDGGKAAHRVHRTPDDPHDQQRERRQQECERRDGPQREVRGARKGVTSKRTVARKVSRLSKRIKTLKP